jgi:hypothetical protein
MSEVTSLDVFTILPGEIRKPMANYFPDLGTGETLTGTPTVTIAQHNTTAPAPAVSNPAIIANKEGNANSAVEFVVDASGEGITNGDFLATVLCETSNSPVRKGFVMIIRVRDK